jgi:hypothetical protein
MTKTFKFAALVLCGLALAGAFNAKAQVRTTAFTIDRSKPYVYLKFDHVGTRKPLSLHEHNKGLWLRLVNNCRVPIVVGTFDLGTGDPGLGVFDEIAPVDLNPPPLGHGLRVGETAPGSGEEKESVPQGYSSGEVVSTTTIAPGTSQLLSLPANHVGPSWMLQIRFYLALPRTSYGSGPYSVVSFDWQDVPDKLRADLGP